MHVVFVGSVAYVVCFCVVCPVCCMHLLGVVLVVCCVFVRVVCALCVL